MRNWISALAALALGAPLIAVSTSVPTAAGATGLAVTRVAGADRYATAAAVADAGWPNALPANSTLLLATGSTFPDAVAGSAAAGHLGVPLLLTASGSLSSSAAAEIDRLKPAQVALLGGTSAIECCGCATGCHAWCNGRALAGWRPIRHRCRNLAGDVSERRDDGVSRHWHKLPRCPRRCGARCRRRRSAVAHRSEHDACRDGERDHQAASVGDRRARWHERGQCSGRDDCSGSRSWSGAVAPAGPRPIPDRRCRRVCARRSQGRDVGEQRRSPRDGSRFP